MAPCSTVRTVNELEAGQRNTLRPAIETWSGRRESNPHDQLGRLELYH